MLASPSSLHPAASAAGRGGVAPRLPPWSSRSQPPARSCTIATSMLAAAVTANAGEDLCRHMGASLIVWLLHRVEKAFERMHVWDVHVGIYLKICPLLHLSLQTGQGTVCAAVFAKSWFLHASQVMCAHGHICNDSNPSALLLAAAMLPAQPVVQVKDFKRSFTSMIAALPARSP